MSVSTRHEAILRELRRSEKPLSGAYLSELFGVSRQIIVKDMNRIKDEGYQVISTARGYILIPSAEVSRIFKVRHSVEDTERELNLIVDQGAEVRDVFIFHRVYGEIHGPLHIGSRRDVAEFCESIRTGKSSPLSTATAGFHYHTIFAKDEATLDRVKEELETAGFLAELTDYEPATLTGQKQ